MKLSAFISENLERIMQEWEDFAATLVPKGERMDPVSLRDDVKRLLESIAADVVRPRSAYNQAERSKVRRPDEYSAATAHGVDRQAAGFSLISTVAEYRALRASVTRLWQEKHLNQPAPTTGIEDVIRFDEAIDQAIAESVFSYSASHDQQARVFETILSSTPDLAFTFDLDGRVAYANQALIAALSLPRDQIVGKSFADLGMPNVADLQREIQQVIRTKQPYRCEIHHPTGSGAPAWHEYIFVPVLNDEGVVEAIAGTGRDVTERKADARAVWEMANFDAVTGLPNRRLFWDRLEHDVKHARRIGARLALLFIDLDHFKEANDRFGHQVGDRILRLAAARIRSCVRETDTAARVGGDEFTVILQDLNDPKQVEAISEKIRQQLAEPFGTGDEGAPISSSIGITLFPRDASTAEQLIKNADEAMYAAKSAGRNQFHWYSVNSVTTFPSP